MGRNGEPRVASLEPARALVMMTGASDCCFKKPRGPYEMKMTTVVAAVGWNNATYGSLGSRLLPRRWSVCIYASMYIVHAFNSLEEVS